MRNILSAPKHKNCRTGPVSVSTQQNRNHYHVKNRKFLKRKSVCLLLRFAFQNIAFGADKIFLTSYFLLFLFFFFFTLPTSALFSTFFDLPETKVIVKPKYLAMKSISFKFSQRDPTASLPSHAPTDFSPASCNANTTQQVLREMNERAQSK